MPTEHPHIVPEIERWPISRFSENRDSFIEEMNEHTLKKILDTPDLTVEEIIASTIYKEKIRVKVSPWKVDPRDEKEYWSKLEKEFKASSLSPQKDELNLVIIKKIINRYSSEIIGNFNPKTFRFARRFLYGFFKRLFNKVYKSGYRRPWGNRKQLWSKIVTKGAIEEIRELSKQGTIVMVPTHHSNLDSIMVGYMIDSKLGIPAFTYGAGLNLFDVEVMAYFMNRLGAYKVDRRKKNKIYLESLNTYSTLAIKRGVNSIFFPGGTRSRSGRLETKLKLGLLGTLIEAQRIHCVEQEEKKIFVVPLIISYHFVLEAKQLIDHHLRATGKEKYLKPGGGGLSIKTVLRFVKHLFKTESEVVFSVGKPMDVFGNMVNKAGNSFDEKGKKLDIRDYFKFNGEFIENLQRERVYTKILGDNIKKSYLSESIILSSHLLAFGVFKYFEASRPNDDLFTLLSLPLDNLTLDMDTAKQIVDYLKNILVDMEANGEIKLSEQIHLPTEDLIADALKNLGVYHARRPLIKRKNTTLVSEDFRLLYFYHNRLDDYNIKLNKDSLNATTNSESASIEKV